MFRLGENLVHPNIRQFIVCFIEKLYYNFSKYQYLGDLMMIEGGVTLHLKTRNNTLILLTQSKDKKLFLDTLTPHTQVVIVKLRSRSKVYLKCLRDLDLELDSIIAMPPPPPPRKLF